MKPKQVLVLAVIFVCLLVGVAVKTFHKSPELATEIYDPLDFSLDAGKVGRIEIGKGAKENIIGWAGVGMSLSLNRVNATVVRVKWTIALLTLLVIALGIVVTTLLVKVIVRPVKQLAAGTKRIAAGELGFKVEVASRDEIGELAASFNGMAEALR